MLISEDKLIPMPPLRINEVIKQFTIESKIIQNYSIYQLPTLIKCCFLGKAPKIAIEFNNNNVDVVRSQVVFFFTMKRSRLKIF